MILSLLAASAMAQGVGPADFFPLVKGSARTYESVGGDRHVDQDVVGAPVMIGAAPATPVSTYEFGQLLSTVFYRIDGDTVFVVAYGGERPSDPPRPLKAPIPVFKLSGDGGTFSFQGYATPPEKDHIPDTISLTGKSRLAGKKTILGKSVDTLEVETDVEIGGGGLGQKNHYVATYAKGIGLVQMVTKTTLARRQSTRTIRITQYQEPKEGG